VLVRVRSPAWFCNPINDMLTLMKKKFPGCDSEYLLLQSAMVALPN
jgi:hypothetical protein